MAETTYDACSTRAYFPGLGYVLLSKREYEKTAKDVSEYMRGIFEEGEGKFGEQEWRTFEYEIARVNNELVKAQKRITQLEAELRAALEGKKDKPTMTEEQLREMMRDPRYWRQRNPEWVKRVTEGFRALTGGKDE